MIVRIDIDNINENVLVVRNSDFTIQTINTYASRNLPDIVSKKLDEILEIEAVEMSKNFLKKDFFLKIDGQKKILCRVIKTLMNTDSSLVFVIPLKEIVNHLFITNLGYEIRTPLNSIIGLTSMLSDTNISEEQRYYIDMLKDSGYDLLKVVNDVVDFIKLENKKITLVNSVFSLKKCLKDAHALILSKILQKNITITQEADLEKYDNLYGDYERLRQIIVNILENAANSSRIAGSIDIKVTTLYKSNKVTEIKFSIKNDGFGISNSEETDLFAENDNNWGNYYLTDNAKKHGLGLYISKSLCELMGGKIWLDWNEEGKGSTFCFVIKFQEKIAIKEEKIVKKGALANKSVMIISKNPDVRISLISELMSENIKCTPCSTPDEIVIFLKYSFDLIIIDIVNDTDILKYIKILKEFSTKNPNVPIFSLGNSEELPQFSKLKLTQTFKKPVNYSDISYEFLKIVSSPSINSLKILIDEDIYLNQIVLQSFLKKLGYTDVITVSNGKQAIDKLKVTKFDICFIDIKTPLVDGFQVVEFILKELDYKPYCVALTGMAKSREDYKSKGFDDYILKPIDTDRLSEILVRLEKNKK